MIHLFANVVNAQNILYKACNFTLPTLIPEPESQEYFAHSYLLEQKNIRFRIAKKTPLKNGYFVTIWKRFKNGSTAPYDQDDNVDLLIINVIHGQSIGQFVFPKTILIKKSIFSQKNKGGKRGFRVYSPWDTIESAQAQSTQKWQIKFFIDITPGIILNVSLAKKLYSNI